MVARQFGVKAVDREGTGRVGAYAEEDGSGEEAGLDVLRAHVRELDDASAPVERLEDGAREPVARG